MNPVAHAPSAAALRVPQDVLDDLARVETRLGEELRAREPRLTEITSHLVGAGGKRVRPMLGFNRFETAAVTIRGIELAEKIKKQQFNLKSLIGKAANAPEIWAAVLAA